MGKEKSCYTFHNWKGLNGKINARMVHIMTLWSWQSESAKIKRALSMVGRGGERSPPFPFIRDFEANEDSHLHFRFGKLLANSIAIEFRVDGAERIWERSSNRQIFMMTLCGAECVCLFKVF